MRHNRLICKCNPWDATPLCLIRPAAKFCLGQTTVPLTPLFIPSCLLDPHAHLIQQHLPSLCLRCASPAFASSVLIRQLLESELGTSMLHSYQAVMNTRWY